MNAEARQLDQGFYFSIVLKISLLISLTAIVSMFVLLLSLVGERGSSYVEIISQFYLTYDRLPLAMFIVGVTLALLTAFTVWFVSLYSSFRVAGPIFRFTKNLEAIVASDGASLTPIRKSDFLQAESVTLRTAVENMRIHYRAMERELQEMEAILDHSDSYPAKLDRIRPVMIHLKMLDDQISL